MSGRDASDMCLCDIATQRLVGWYCYVDTSELNRRKEFNEDLPNIDM